MKKNKNRKLLVEISLITTIIFSAIFVNYSVSDYYKTQEVYLSAKNEMIAYDIDGIRNLLLTFDNMKWFFDYMKVNGDEITARLERGEQPPYADTEYFDTWMEFLSDPDFDVNSVSDEYRARFALHIGGFCREVISDMKERFNYVDVFFLAVHDEHESYIIDDSGEKVLRSHDVSEHSAIKQMLDGSIKSEDQTVFEKYYDKSRAIYCYTGYEPFFQDGELIGYIGLEYDWSAFHNDRKRRMIISIAAAFAVLLVLNGLLVFYLNVKAIAPVSKVKESMLDYMENKDSEAVREKMNGIRVRNEIGVLADSFAGLAEEMNRYTGEIRQLTADREHAEAELSVAARIQEDIIPGTFPAFPERREFDIYASMDPAREVGGDFYDFFMIDDDRLVMVMADVSGKGVPAALFMMSTNIRIHERASMGGTPAEILSSVNANICKNNQSLMFVTVWLGILELSTGRLIAASAGHECPMIKKGAKYEMLKDKHGRPLGVKESSAYENYELMLKKGDGLFVYTDGVAEATDKDDRMFTTDRMLEVLNSNTDLSPEDTLRNMRRAVDDFVKDAPQFDDLTMLCLKYYGA